MSEPRPRLSPADLEAQRALLREAIADLPAAANPDRAADDVLRALDAYLESAVPQAAASREQPVTDYRRPYQDDINWPRMLVVGGAVLATIIVAVVLAGGWPAAVAIVVIWAVALFALTST